MTADVSHIRNEVDQML